MIHQAALALEWFHASGDRTPDRLHKLVEHQCDASAIVDHGTRAAIYLDALEHARMTPEPSHYRAPEPPAVDATDQGLQYVIPGAERRLVVSTGPRRKSDPRQNDLF